MPVESPEEHHPEPFIRYQPLILSVMYVLSRQMSISRRIPRPPIYPPKDCGSLALLGIHENKNKHAKHKPPFVAQLAYGFLSQAANAHLVSPTTAWQDFLRQRTRLLLLLLLLLRARCFVSRGTLPPRTESARRDERKRRRADQASVVAAVVGEEAQVVCTATIPATRHNLTRKAPLWARPHA